MGEQARSLKLKLTPHQPLSCCHTHIYTPSHPLALRWLLSLNRNYISVSSYIFCNFVLSFLHLPLLSGDTWSRCTQYLSRVTSVRIRKEAALVKVEHVCVFMFGYDGVYFLQACFQIRGLCLRMCSYLQNNISRDVPLCQWGETAGGQEEFQIFDKHVKATKSGLVIMPVLLLPSSMEGINFQTKMFWGQVLKFRLGCVLGGIKMKGTHM